MEPQPLPKELYDRAVECGVEAITLNWEGGNDEGVLEVILEPYRNIKNFEHDLEEDIYNWALLSYSYSGAGDGSRYGDQINYNLVTKEVSTSEWYQVTEYEDGSVYPLNEFILL